MKTIKNFFTTIYTSTISPSFYIDAVKKPFLNSYLYFLSLCILIGIIMGIVYSVQAVPAFNELIRTVKSKAKTAFPPNVTLSVNNGSVSTNVQEPYIIPNPDKTTNNNKKNLLVIDTKGNVPDLYTYDTYALVTKHDISFQQNETQIRTYSLRDVKRFILNREVFNQWVDKLIPYLVYVIPVIVTFIFFGAILGTVISKIIAAVLFSLLAWIIGIITKVYLPYKKYLQTTFYALTPVLLLETIFAIFNFHPNIPFLSTIVFLIFAILGIRSIKKDQETVKK